MNKFDEMKQAINEAKEVMRAADDNANAMASILRGRLRNCSSWNLEALKREISEYNIKTRRWKS
jgi:hypothetical protein